MEDFNRIGDFTWRVPDFEELVGGLLTGDDEVGLVQKKQSKRVQIVCSRTTRARRKICQFYAISLQKQAIIEDIQQNVYTIILLIILSLFIVSCYFLPTLIDFGSGD